MFKKRETKVKSGVKRVELIEKNDSFENDFKMLNYFQNEFMQRDSHFWKMVVYSFLLIVVITILPIVKEIFGIALDYSLQHFAFAFPIIGFIIALLSLIILLNESKRVNAVNQVKYRINELMEKKYQYIHYAEDHATKAGESKDKKYSIRINGQIPLVYKIPYVVFLFELLIIAVVTALLIYGLKNQ